jgi:RHS repeat-associated protein
LQFPTFDPIGYRGEEGCYTDNESDPVAGTTIRVRRPLVLMGMRTYDPMVGRFLTRDPIGYSGGINLYAYAGGNPVTGSDPTGLDWLDDLSNFSAGAGDTFSFGLTGRIRQWMGTDGVVNRSSGMYVGGQVSATVVGIVEGGAGAVSAVRAVKAAGGVRAAIAGLRAARTARSSLVIASGAGNDVRAATIVRVLKKGEKIEDLVSEAKNLTYERRVEHAVISLKDGQRVLVSGGHDGITLPTNTRRILGHTHPPFLANGANPSPGDIAALKKLGQTRSYIFGGGQRTLFRPR